ncbi:MAG: potassium-transporting ATPase subunit C, partial [Comamonadaceae bacterium]
LRLARQKLAAALYQVTRVSGARRMPAEQVRALVDAHTERPLLAFLGEAKVNVLQLNLALDARAAPIAAR